ncbi:MAG: TetR/AcrR family transcriptional regulator [Acidimicrobiales bacterium]
MTCDTTPPADLDPRVARSRAKILDAATQLLVESGARGVTVDAVAARSGVSKATLYRHWDSRDAVLADVLRHNMPVLPEIDLATGFVDAFRAVITALGDQACDPEWQRILPALFVLKHQTAEIERLAEAEREEQEQVLETVLQLGVDEGLLPADLEIELVVHQLVGPVLFAAMVEGGDLPARVAAAVSDDFLAAHR